MHAIQLDPQLVARLTQQRGGQLHTIAAIDPRRTAHIVVDMQNGFLEPGAPVEVPLARQIVPAVNRISRAARAAGAGNYFLHFTTPVGDLAGWSVFYGRSPEDVSREHQDAFTPGAHGWQLWPEMDFDPAADRQVAKRRFGAFVPGTCDLHEQLQAAAIDTLIITGTLTNCCCETTAREAMQLNYRVIFVSDGCAALSDAEHNATLNNMLFLFADVRSSDEVVALLG